MKRKTLLCFIVVLVSVFSFVKAQNSFQKELLTDSLGFVGVKVLPDSGYLLATQTQKSCKLLNVNKYGLITNVSLLNVSATVYIQHMLSTQDGGCVLTGSIDGSSLVIKLNSNNEVVWAKKREPGFGFGDTFYFMAAEDNAGNITLIENRQGVCVITCINNAGSWLWSRLSPDIDLFNLVKSASEGGFYLSGYTNYSCYLYKISAEGITNKTWKFTLPQLYPMLSDFVELEDSSKIFLFQFTINYKNSFVLAHVLPDLFIQYSYAYGSTYGFKYISDLLMPDNAHLIVMGNEYQSGTGPIFNHPYRIMRADFGIGGNFLSAVNYTAGRSISGLSQVKLTPDKGIIACGYSCDSLQIPFYPYLFKTDANGRVPCFTDSLSIVSGNYMLGLNNLDQQLITIPDSLVDLDLSFSTTSIPVFNNLCYTGISEQNTQEILTLSPNPATDYITLNFNGILKTNSSVAIYNIIGQQLSIKEINQQPESLQLNISDLSKGLYIIKLQFNKNLYTSRFIKK